MGDSSGVDCVSKFDWAILSQIECAMGSSAVLIRVTSTPCWCVEAKMAGAALCLGPVCIALHANLDVIHQNIMLFF